MEFAGWASRTTYFPSLLPLAFEPLKCITASQVSFEPLFNKESCAANLRISLMVPLRVEKECSQGLYKPLTQLVSFSIFKDIKQKV